MVLLFIVAHFAYHLIGGQLSPLLPLIREEFQLDYTQTGFMLAALNLTAGLANLPAGWLADRIGRPLLITISICGVGLAGLLISFSHSYFMMVVALILFGAVGGGYHVSAPPLIAASTEPKKQGAALGLHMIGGTGSLFVAPLVAVGIAGLWGWRSPYLVLSIPVTACGLLLYVLLRRRLARKETAGPVPVGETKSAATTAVKPPAKTNWPRLVAFLVLSVLSGALIWTPVAFLPLFLVDELGATQTEVGVFVSLTAVGGVISGPFGGYLADRFGPARVMAVMLLLAVPLVLLMNIAPYGIALGAVLVGIGMIATTRIPVAESFILVNAPARHRSTVLGIFYFSGAELGGVFTPAIGAIIDRYGFSTAFILSAAGTLVVVLVCSIWLWRASKMSQTRPAT